MQFRNDLWNAFTGKNLLRVYSILSNKVIIIVFYLYVFYYIDCHVGGEWIHFKNTILPNLASKCKY